MRPELRRSGERVGFNDGVFIGVGARLHASNDFQGGIICRSLGQLMKNCRGAK
jgi:hypothetical protein